MFSRIKEAVRIMSFRETESGADTIIVECEDHLPTLTPAGRTISRLIEYFLVLYCIGYAAGYLGIYIAKHTPAKHLSASTTTLIGFFGALLMMIGTWLKQDIENKIQSHLRISEWLAPFFGHRLTYAYHVLKGRARAA